MVKRFVKNGVKTSVAGSCTIIKLFENLQSCDVYEIKNESINYLNLKLKGFFFLRIHVKNDFIFRCTNARTNFLIILLSD